MSNGENGMWLDHKGRMVPDALVKPIDKLRDELVRELFGEAAAVNRELVAFKERVFADIAAFVDMSLEQYGVGLGGRKGNVSLVSFDGRFRIQLAIADRLVFDERLQAAKALIDECIIDWSQGSRDEIRVLVQSAFQTDQSGKINTGRVLSLRRLDIQDVKWQLAMRAIGDSLQVVGSKAYVRFYERVGDTDQYRQLSLDVAAL